MDAFLNEFVTVVNGFCVAFVNGIPNIFIAESFSGYKHFSIFICLRSNGGWLSCSNIFWLVSNTTARTLPTYVSILLGRILVYLMFHLTHYTSHVFIISILYTNTYFNYASKTNKSFWKSSFRLLQ